MVQPSSKIAKTLRLIADDLETKGKDLTLSPQDRRLSLRYAPFARELSRRQEFCEALERLDFDGYTSISEINDMIQALIAGYQLPRSKPYDSQDWMILLSSAKNGLIGFAPRFFERHPYMYGPLVEIQFAYTGRHAQGKPPDPRLPIVVAANVMIPDESTRSQVLDSIAAELHKPFATFRRRLKPLIKEGNLPYFDVRFVTFKANLPDDSKLQTEFQGLNQPLFSSSVIAETAKLISPGSHSKRLVKNVVENLMPAIEELVTLVPGHGRRPEQDHARWWAMTVFDDMSVNEIAEKELNYNPAPVDRYEAIERALHRLGIQLQTK